MCFDCDLLVTEHDIRMNKYIVCYKYVILNMYITKYACIYKLAYRHVCLRYIYNIIIV